MTYTQQPADNKSIPNTNLVQVVAAPGGGQRRVLSLIIFNRTSVDGVLTVQRNDNGKVTRIFRGEVSAGDTFVLNNPKQYLLYPNQSLEAFLLAVPEDKWSVSAIYEDEP